MKQFFTLSVFALALIFSSFATNTLYAVGYPQSNAIGVTHVTATVGADASSAHDGMNQILHDGGGGDGNNSHLLLEDESVVYPNPSDGPINIRFETAMDVQWVQAFNTLGQRIHPPIHTLQTGKVYRVDLSGFTPGIYFLRVKVAEEVHVKRVILR